MLHKVPGDADAAGPWTSDHSLKFLKALQVKKVRLSCNCIPSASNLIKCNSSFSSNNRKKNLPCYDGGSEGWPGCGESVAGSTGQHPYSS